VRGVPILRPTKEYLLFLQQPFRTSSVSQPHFLSSTPSPRHKRCGFRALFTSQMRHAAHNRRFFHSLGSVTYLAIIQNRSLLHPVIRRCDFANVVDGTNVKDAHRATSETSIGADDRLRLHHQRFGKRRSHDRVSRKTTHVRYNFALIRIRSPSIPHLRRRVLLPISLLHQERLKGDMHEKQQLHLFSQCPLVAGPKLLAQG
jgi:hypothetical protein